mgnify:FL=1
MTHRYRIIKRLGQYRPQYKEGIFGRWKHFTRGMLGFRRKGVYVSCTSDIVYSEQLENSIKVIGDHMKLWLEMNVKELS